MCGMSNLSDWIRPIKTYTKTLYSKKHGIIISSLKQSYYENARNIFIQNNLKGEQ